MRIRHDGLGADDGVGAGMKLEPGDKVLLVVKVIHVLAVKE